MVTKKTNIKAGEFMVDCPKCGNQFPLNDRLRTHISGQETKAIQEAAYEKAAKDFEQERLEAKRVKRQLAKEKEERLALEQEVVDAEVERKRAVQKALLKEIPKLAEAERLKAEEAEADKWHLKMAEKEKVIADQKTAIDEMSRKLSKGSQETQGTVAEIDLAQQLEQSFSQDDVSRVGKGIRGADVLQKVCFVTGTTVGSILWESKDTQKWDPEWLSKARADKRTASADCVVIVTTTLPASVKTFDTIDGVMVAARPLVLPIAKLLRAQLAEIARVDGLMIDRATKEARLFAFVNGKQFKSVFDQLIDYLDQAGASTAKTRDAMNQAFERQLKTIGQISDLVIGMHGGLQGIVGASMEELLLIEGPKPQEGEAA